MLSIDLPPARKRTFIFVTMLLALNGGLAHRIFSQIQEKNAPHTVAMVKDDRVTIADASKLAADKIGSKIADQITVHAEERPTITTYTVQSGDTLSSIATKFNVSVNTVRWANDLTTKTSTIKPGMELTILPVSGIEYTVKKGDTLSDIATKFDANQEDILAYNDVEASSIKVGMDLVIPNAEPLSTPAAPAPKEPVKKVVTEKVPVKTAATATKTPEKTVAKVETVQKTEVVAQKEEKEDEPEKTSTKFVNPIPAGVLTQRIHDGNAVDFGAPVGTLVRAAASGTVTIAKSGGYNGGYGNMIVITHTDGSQTLYAHLSKVSVSVGDSVSQGETIAFSGNTGLSTGPHLHYKEINTGTKNTFVNLKLAL